MEKYWDLFFKSFINYGGIWYGKCYTSWGNYFYWLLGLSLFCWLQEIIVPWRQHQAKIRQDFWLDGFYMFFNFSFFRSSVLMPFPILACRLLMISWRCSASGTW
jgi:hypothetical protein